MRATETRRGLVLLALLWCAAPVSGQVRQGMVSLPDGRLFYEVVGAGDPVIVVHGGPGLDHNYLRPGLDVLGAGRALVYYDQRGTGRSSAPLDSSSLSLERFVADIEDLRIALGYERVTVLGHSFGGLVAMGYALEHPERTRALVLLNSVEPGSRWAEEARERASASRSPEDAARLAELAASPGYTKGDPATLSEMYRVAFRGTLRDPARLDDLNLSLSAATARNGPAVARLLGGSASGVDWWERLGALSVPTLVVAGRHDPTPPAMARALAEAIPGGELVVLETGHFPFVEDPSGLTQAVATFLAGPGR